MEKDRNRGLFLVLPAKFSYQVQRLQDNYLEQLNLFIAFSISFSGLRLEQCALGFEVGT